MTKIGLFLLLILLNQYAFASFTSAAITKNTIKAASKLNGSCLNYKLPTRVCLWVTPFGGINKTPFLDHYLPDLVVVVYRNGDENPWIEARNILDKAAHAVQEAALPGVGSGDHAFLNERDHDVIFKEADVIGNPGLITLQTFRFALLPSTATPMRPYFQSMLDSALWRGFMPQAGIEQAASVLLGKMHHVGTGITDWGGIYPHDGFVMGTDDLKASMVIAQRATDLLTTNKFFGHLRTPLSNECGEHCEAEPIQENSKETLFQMISPVETDECAVFGTNESYNEEAQNAEGAYAWIVWRHYRGCVEGEGKFIGVTP